MRSKMAEEKIEFGSNLMAHLEKLVKTIDTNRHDLTETILYMEHIKSKMTLQYLVNSQDERILEQIKRMDNCIRIVHQLREDQIASSM
jgi:hypothetical protein